MAAGNRDTDVDGVGVTGAVASTCPDVPASFAGERVSTVATTASKRTTPTAVRIRRPGFITASSPASLRMSIWGKEAGAQAEPELPRLPCLSARRADVPDESGAHGQGRAPKEQERQQNEWRDRSARSRLAGCRKHDRRGGDRRRGVQRHGTAFLIGDGGGDRL